ncbi:hypothetical protein ILYODFUR_033720 [Ilyodon furcidens]|uniref:Uncharacterized protein n=1 Tax=Ilyodon furcidens TaxID=33524 RepID=A0ABV0SRB0_9TELE
MKSDDLLVEQSRQLDDKGEKAESTSTSLCHAESVYMIRQDDFAKAFILRRHDRAAEGGRDGQLAGPSLPQSAEAFRMQDMSQENPLTLQNPPEKVTRKQSDFRHRFRSWNKCITNPKK